MTLSLYPDTLFDKVILTDLIKHEGNILAISKKKVGDEEMKGINNDSGNLLKVSKIGEVNDPESEKKEPLPSSIIQLRIS